MAAVTAHETLASGPPEYEAPSDNEAVSSLCQANSGVRSRSRLLEIASSALGRASQSSRKGTVMRRQCGCIGVMGQTDSVQRDERFSWIADAETVRAARTALPVPRGMVVSDYEMRVSVGSSGRTFRGFESFADALIAGVESFSYGAISHQAPGAIAMAGVRVEASRFGTNITIYAADDEVAAKILNAIRAAAPVRDAGPGALGDDLSEPTRIGVADLHPRVVSVAKSLFDSGHYFQAEFEAFKSLESRVRELAGSDKSGVDLMGEAFRATSPLIDTATDPGRSGAAQREGYLALFRGAMLAVRDPKAHILARDLEPSDTLEYLAFASLLHRRLDVATQEI